MGGSFHGVRAIASKDLRLLLRDKANAFFTFVFPLLLAMFFGFIFGGGGGGGQIDVAVYAEEPSPATAAFLQALDADSAIRVRPVIEKPGASEGVTEPVMVATRAEGEALVRKGKVVACLLLPKGFDPDSIMTSGGIEIGGVVDPKSTAEVGLLEGKLNQIAFVRMSSAFGDPTQMSAMMDKARTNVRGSDMNPAQKLLFEALFGSIEGLSRGTAPEKQEGAAAPAEGGFQWQPVKISLTKLKVEGVSPPSSFAISFPQGVVWGLMGCVTAFAYGFAEERTKGTLRRLGVAPLSMGSVLLGKALACFLACLLVEAMLIAFSFAPPFNVRVGNWGMLTLAMLVSAIGFTGVMMALAGAVKSGGAASGLGRAAILILAMIGGGTIPVFFMPPVMQTVSGVSPFKWVTIAVEGALWRGFTLREMALPAAILLAFGVVGYAMGAMGLKRSGMG